MKDFFKDYLFSYFSHKHAKNIFTRSFLITFINVILMALSLVFSIYVGDQISFSYSYDKAADFQEVLSSCLTQSVTIKNNKIELGYQYDSFKEDTNDYINKNHYEVIIDTRDAATTFEIFNLSIKTEDSSTEISYADYLLLDDSIKSDYTIEIVHTGDFLDTEANLTKYENYLDNLETKTAYNSLKTRLQNGEITHLQYANKIYVLYGSFYYPEEVYEGDSYGSMPTMRTYYEDSLYYSYSDNDYLYIYEDEIGATFKSSTGKQSSFTGFFGENKTYNLTEYKESSIKDFINDAFNAGNEYRFLIDYVIGFFVWFTMIIVLVVETIIFRLILRKIHPNSIVYTMKLLNLEGSFILFSSFVSFIYTLIGSFFLFKFELVLSSAILLFLLILLRTIIFFIREKNFDDSVKDE